MQNLLTVSQLNRYSKALFDENKLLSHLLVRGEISNLSSHFSSGHLYFSLRDQSASVRAVMFKSHAQRLRFRPENGQTVLVSCSVTLYERDGQYQLAVYDMQPDGVGAQALALEQRKEKLEREGLFSLERKRPLPRFPQRIGVVTSATGAVLQDIRNVLERRYPVAIIVLAPVPVQGEGAAPAVIAALQQLNQALACDVIILGRGGGSSEDLSAFNDEQLVRAIAASNIPIVSAVGHETDFTLADLAADLRAPTPSAAAELVAPNRFELCQAVQSARETLLDTMLARIYACASQLANEKRLLQQHRPDAHLEQCHLRLNKLSQELHQKMKLHIQQAEQSFGTQLQLLESLNPLGVLARGYSIAFYQGKPLEHAMEVEPGQHITVRLAHGQVEAEVLERREGTE